MPGRQAQQDLRYMFDSFGKLSEALKKQREEKMAKELLEEIDPEYSGESLSSYKLRQDVEDKKLEREYRRAQIKKALREKSSLVGDDGLTPYQRLQAEMSERRIEQADRTHERLLNPTPTPKLDTIDSLNDDVIAATGRPLSDWNKAENKRLDRGQFKADLDGETVNVPQNLYNKFLQRHRKLEGSEPNADPYAQQVRPSVTPTPKPASTGSSPVVTEGEPPVVRSKAQWDALPPGTKYLAPDGTIRIKQ